MPYVRAALCPHCGKRETFTFELSTTPSKRSCLIRCDEEATSPQGCGKDYVVYWAITISVSTSTISRRKPLEASEG